MAEKQVKKQLPQGMIDKQFKPGQSGNPKGRPKKGSAMADVLNELGEEKLTANGKEISRLRAMLLRVYTQAIKGNMAAVNFIADRTEGKALDRVDLSISEYAQIIDDIDVDTQA